MFTASAPAAKPASPRRSTSSATSSSPPWGCAGSTPSPRSTTTCWRFRSPCSLITFVIPGWSEGPDPESRDSPMCNCTSWLAATQRPGMTALKVTTSVIAKPSIRLRQAQHLLGNETENELRADRGDAGDQGFPQISLDMIFLGVAESAMGHHRLLAGVKTRFRGQIFRRVGGGPAGQALIVLPPCRQHHQPGRFQFHPVLRQRMLNALVHADRPVEHDAALRVSRSALKRDLAEPDRFRRDQNPLRIHAVQDVFETAPLFPKAILGGDFKILEEQFVGVDGLAA